MKRRRMDASLWVLVGLTGAVLVYAFLRDPSLPMQGFMASARLLNGVWIELALGFLLAGLIDVLVPASTIATYLGSQRAGHGILIGWVAGLAMPGGPYLFFPVAAKLLASGTSPAALITFLTAKTLLSPVRMLTYEAPLLGWPLTLARFIPGVLLPPLMGWAGQWIYLLIREKI